jgi:ABC-2 type transport system permease protein
MDGKNITRSKKGISDDLRQIGVVTKYELLKHVRSKRFLILIGIVAMMFTLTTVLIFALDGGLPSDKTEFMSAYTSFVSIMIIIAVSLICGSAIASEFEERTALLMFPRPMKRMTFFIGKALSSFIACGAVVMLYYGVCVLLSLLCTGGLDMNTFGSLGIAMLFILGTGGFALLMSSLFKKGTISIIVTILVLLLAFYMIIDSTMIFFEVEPTFSVTYAGMDIQNYIAGRPSGLQTVEAMPGMEMDVMFLYPTHAMAASLCIAWFAVTTTISALLFRRKEF